MNHPLLLAHYAAQPWALTPDYLSLCASVLARWDRGDVIGEGLRAQIDHDQSIVAARRERAAAAPGSVAVIPVYGLLMQRPPADISGPQSTSTMQLTQAIKMAAADPAISSIVLDIDSPGGSVHGLIEAGEAIYQAGQTKPVIAIANSFAASAAFWLGCQATEFYAAPGAQVGSIGVYSAHTYIGKALEKDGIEITLISAGKYKTEGNPYNPLGEDALNAMQLVIDQYMAKFVEAVARGRKTTPSAVRSGMGEGRVLFAEDALAANMIDGIRTLDDIIGQLTAKAGKPAQTTARARAQRDIDLLTA